MSTHSDSNGGETSAQVINETMQQPAILCWAGGDHAYQGPHDPFCFMCGSSGNTFHCRTCSRCYHSQCMFPPLGPTQIPDVWFCPVCVGRNWHIPPIDTWSPPVSSLASPNVPGLVQDDTTGTNILQDEDDTIHSTTVQSPGALTRQAQTGAPKSPSQSWRDAQRWKKNAQYAPRGYVLDPLHDDRFISLTGNSPAVPLSDVANKCPNQSGEDRTSKSGGNQVASKTTDAPEFTEKIQGPQRKVRKRQKSRSPSRRRSKYSNLPTDLENALGLIKARLESNVRNRNAQEDAKGETEAVEQRLRISEGEMRLCRHEMQAVKQKLSAESSNAKKLESENAQLRKEVKDLEARVREKENQIDDWQKMLRTMLGKEPTLSL